ncbi:MAG: hypothetical protein BWY83_01392 [bacterium ADurb.Bin478]|nr:MAG: hypothetical protein BWY83_01392 [bacterium ADurb.Bin478]
MGEQRIQAALNDGLAHVLHLTKADHHILMNRIDAAAANVVMHLVLQIQFPGVIQKSLRIRRSGIDMSQRGQRFGIGLQHQAGVIVGLFEIEPGRRHILQTQTVGFLFGSRFAEKDRPISPRSLHGNEKCQRVGDHAVSVGFPLIDGIEHRAEIFLQRLMIAAVHQQIMITRRKPPGLVKTGMEILRIGDEIFAVAVPIWELVGKNPGAIGRLPIKMGAGFFRYKAAAGETICKSQFC